MADRSQARVALIDYGMGNLRSVQYALEAVGAEVRLVGAPATVGDATHLVLPGVGAFGDAMQRLERQGWVDGLTKVAGDGLPLLGICLGMQLLADLSTEHGEHRGLGLVPGRVDRLHPGVDGLRIPHSGWNDVDVLVPGPLFEATTTPVPYYFVHSYAFVAEESAHVAASCTYGVTFAAVVVAGNVVGAQFHPEKSQRDGLRFLSGFLDGYSC